MSMTPIAAPVQGADMQDQSLFLAQMTAFLPQIPLARIVTIHDDVPASGREVGVASEVDDITGDQACSSAETGTGNLVITKRTLLPHPFMVNKGQCIVDLRTATGWQEEWSKVRPRHLEDNREFINFVSQFYGPGFSLDLYRFMMLGDSDAELEADGGYLKAGTSLAKYNKIDGWWKQIMDAGSSIKRVTLSKNTLTTTAAQMAYTGEEMVAFLQDAKRKADPRMKTDLSRCYFLVTDHWYATIEAYYEKSKLTAVGVAEGPTGLTVGRVSLIPVPLWDRYIGNVDNAGDTSQNSGASKYYPNRFIFGVPESFHVAPSYNPNQPVFDVEYNPEDKDIDFIAEMALDTKVGNYSFLVAGY